MLRGREAGTRSFVCTNGTHVAGIVIKLGAQKADIGSFLSCCGDSLPEHCTPRGIEN